MPLIKKPKQSATLTTSRGVRSSDKTGSGKNKVVRKPVDTNSILTYIRNLARDPSQESIPMNLYGKHKSLVQKILMALYQGPELGKKGGRKTRDSRKRPCSPTLFRDESVFELCVRACVVNK